MPELSSNRNHQRGTALLLFTLMLLTVVLPLIGLAIDGGVAYFAHARLVAAADAAALAGGRALNVGLDLASQTAYVQGIVNQYVQANFPAGMLNASNLQVSAQITETQHIRTVQVQTSMNVGLYSLGLLGHPTVNIAASAATSRRDVNLVMTLDRSGSMGGVCGIMKSDAQNFVSKWTNGRDTLGLITFMGNASVDYPSTKFFDSQTPSLTATLKTLNCGGNTGSAAALSLAHQQIMNVAEPGALNVIVFFTDGVPNGFTAGPAPASGVTPGFPVLTGKTCNGGNPVMGYIADGGGIFSPGSRPIYDTATPTVNIMGCSPGSFAQLSQNFAYVPEQDYYGNSAILSNYAPVARDSHGHIVFSNANSDAVSQNAADDAARRARGDGIVIYTIGLDGDGGVDSTLLRRLANDPASPVFNTSQPAGKYYFSPNAGQLASIWNSIASEILRIAR